MNGGNKQPGPRTDSNQGDRSNMSIQADDVSGQRERFLPKKRNGMAVGVSGRTCASGGKPPAVQKVQMDQSRDDLDKVKLTPKNGDLPVEGEVAEKQQGGADWGSWNPFKRRLHVLRQLEEEEDEEEDVGDGDGVADLDLSKKADINKREDGPSEQLPVNPSAPPVASSDASAAYGESLPADSPRRGARGAGEDDLERGSGGRDSERRDPSRRVPTQRPVPEGALSCKPRGKESRSACTYSPSNVVTSGSSTRRQETVSSSLPTGSRRRTRPYCGGRDDEMLSTSCSDVSPSDRSAESQQRRQKTRRSRSRGVNDQGSRLLDRYVSKEVDERLESRRGERRRNGHPLRGKATRHSRYTDAGATTSTSSEEGSTPGEEGRTTTEYEGGCTDSFRRYERRVRRREHRFYRKPQERRRKRKACAACHRDRWERKTRRPVRRHAPVEGRLLDSGTLVQPPLLRERLEVRGGLQGSDMAAVVAVNQLPGHRLRSQEVAGYSGIASTAPFERARGTEGRGRENESSDAVGRLVGPELVCYSFPGSDACTGTEPPGRDKGLSSSGEGRTQTGQKVLWRFRLPAGHLVTHLALSSDVPPTAAREEENSSSGDFPKSLTSGSPASSPRSSSSSALLLVVTQPVSVMLAKGKQPGESPACPSRSSPSVCQNGDGKTFCASTFFSPSGLLSRHYSRDQSPRSHARPLFPASSNPLGCPRSWTRKRVTSEREELRVRVYGEACGEGGSSGVEEALLSGSEFHSAGDAAAGGGACVPRARLYVFGLQTGIRLCPVTEIPLPCDSCVALCRWIRVDFGSLLGCSSAPGEGKDSSANLRRRCSTPSKRGPLLSAPGGRACRCIALLTTCAQLSLFTAQGLLCVPPVLVSEEALERAEVPTFSQGSPGAPGALLRSEAGSQVGRPNRAEPLGISARCSTRESFRVPALSQPLTLIGKVSLASTCSPGVLRSPDVGRVTRVASSPSCRSSEENPNCRPSCTEFDLPGRPDSIVWVEVQPRCLWLDCLLGLPRALRVCAATEDRQPQGTEKTALGNSSETDHSQRKETAGDVYLLEEVLADREIQGLCEAMGFPLKKIWLQIIVGCASGKIWVSRPPRTACASFQGSRVASNSDCCSLPFDWVAEGRDRRDGSVDTSEGAWTSCAEERSTERRSRRMMAGRASSRDEFHCSEEGFVRIDDLPFQHSDFFSLLDWSQLRRRLETARSSHSGWLRSASAQQTSCVGAPFLRQHEGKETTPPCHLCCLHTEACCSSPHQTSRDEETASRFPRMVEACLSAGDPGLRQQFERTSLPPPCRRFVEGRRGSGTPGGLKDRQPVSERDTCAPSPPPGRKVAAGRANTVDKCEVAGSEPRPLRVLQKRMGLADACSSTGHSLMKNIHVGLSEPVLGDLLRRARSGPRISSVLHTAAAVALAGGSAAWDYGQVLWGHSPVLLNDADVVTATEEDRDCCESRLIIRRGMIDRGPADTSSEGCRLGCGSGDGGSSATAERTSTGPARTQNEQKTERSCPGRAEGANDFRGDCSDEEQGEADDPLSARRNYPGSRACEGSPHRLASLGRRGDFSHSVKTAHQLREVGQKLERNQQVLLSFLIHGRVLGPEFARLLSTTPAALKCMRLEVCEQLSSRLQEIRRSEEGRGERDGERDARQDTRDLYEKDDDLGQRETDSAKKADAVPSSQHVAAVETRGTTEEEVGDGLEGQAVITGECFETERGQSEAENGAVSSTKERERDEMTMVRSPSDGAGAVDAKSKGIARIGEGVRQEEEEEEVVEVVTIDSDENATEDEAESKAEGVDEKGGGEQGEPALEQALSSETDEPLQTSGGQRLTLQHLEHQVWSSIAISSVADLLFWLPALLRRQAELLLLPQLRATALLLLVSYGHLLADLCRACERNEDLVRRHVRRLWRVIRCGANQGRMNRLSRSLGSCASLPFACRGSKITWRGGEREDFSSPRVLAGDARLETAGSAAPEKTRCVERKPSTLPELPLPLSDGEAELPLIDWWTLGALRLDPEYLGSLVLRVLQGLRKQEGTRTTGLPGASTEKKVDGGLKVRNQQMQPACGWNFEGLSRASAAQSGPSVNKLGERSSTDKELGVSHSELRREDEDAQATGRRYQNRKTGDGEQRGDSDEAESLESPTAMVLEQTEAAIQAVLHDIRANREAVKNRIVSLAALLDDRRAALLALGELRECEKRGARRERSRSLGWIYEATSDEEELLERTAVVSELLEGVF